MKKNHKSIDSYFESARKYKSPFSRDKARSLLENKDFIKHNKNTYFSKKGVLKMTIISSVLLVFLLGTFNLGLFNSNTENTLTINNIPNEKPIEKKINTTKHKNLSSINIKPKSNKVSKQLTKNKSKKTKLNLKKNDFILGLHTIKLTEKELNNMGIYYAVEDGDTTINEKIPCIQYYKRISDKAYSLEIITHKYFKTGYFELSNEDSINFIKIYPAMITNFDGGKRMVGLAGTIDEPELKDFIPFYKSLRWFNGISFQKGHFPNHLPKEINNDLNKLNNLIKEFKNSHNTKKTGLQIDTLLNKIYDYFDNLTKKDNGKYRLSKKDSNFSSLIVAYVLNPNDSASIKYKEQMAKLGIKIVYSELPVSIGEYLNKHYKELADNLGDISKQIDDYIRINKLVAIEIPFKDDPNNDGLIFWYLPTNNLLRFLPDKIANELRLEFKYLDKKAICGAPIDKQKAYLDIWKSCSGAIEHLRLFPNPVYSELKIKFELSEKRNLTFSIYNIFGEKVLDLQKSDLLSIGTNTMNFNLSNLKNGMYYIVITSSAGEQVIQKFIKK